MSDSDILFWMLGLEMDKMISKRTTVAYVRNMQIVNRVHIISVNSGQYQSVRYELVL